ncbi:MAG: patatin-like phospholipase family protein [Ginsengibacter sp.]
MKKIKILSIDGGGIRGIIPGVILTYLEKQLQAISQTDLKLGDYFDFIAGTSTGGILSCLYLTPGPNGKARYSANDAVALYLQEGHSIFTKGNFEKIIGLYSLFEPKYSSAHIEKYLLQYFGNIKLNELIKPCLITAYEIVQRNAILFTSSDAVTPLRNFYVRDVARATSAAPTYFPPAHIKSDAGETLSLIDGGVYANNPSLCAYAEARKIKFKEINFPSAKNMLIISVGTGTVRKQYHYKNFKDAGEIKWLEPVIDILMSANSETVHYQLTKMYQTLEPIDTADYYRLEPSLFEACSEMDEVTSENLENLRQAGLLFIDKNERLLNEIAEKILHYT